MGCTSRTGCAHCEKGSLITIRMRIAGEEIVFQRCARCEVNVWEGEAGVISLDQVLELARSTR